VRGMQLLDRDDVGEGGLDRVDVVELAQLGLDTVSSRRPCSCSQ
jgi:hypothetical protein